MDNTPMLLVTFRRGYPLFSQRRGARMAAPFIDRTSMKMRSFLATLPHRKE